jgi:xanthine/uracil/vitamin C permease (AzgA family)
VIFSFMLVNLFDSSGTLIGVTDKAGLADEKGKFPRMKQALFVDSISSVRVPLSVPRLLPLTLNPLPASPWAAVPA